MYGTVSSQRREGVNGSVDESYDKTLHDLPKIELHCHLDGAFRLPTVIDIAKQRGIELVSYDEKELAKYAITSIEENASLPHFLEHFKYFSPAFTGSEFAIRRLTLEAIEDCSKQSIIYIEFRFSPHLLANKDNFPLHTADGTVGPRDVVEVVLAAANEAKSLYPEVKVKFILCAIVAYPQWSNEIAQLCADYSDKGVVGMDLAGDCSIPITPEEWKLHKAAFDYAHDHNVGITIHAGEAEGPESCRIALDDLHASRVGHGYHIVQDINIYNRFLEEKHHLECCPISSYRTGSISQPEEQHPIVRMNAVQKMKSDIMKIRVQNNREPIPVINFLDWWNVNIGHQAVFDYAIIRQAVISFQNWSMAIDMLTENEASNAEQNALYIKTDLKRTKVAVKLWHTIATLGIMHQEPIEANSTDANEMEDLIRKCSSKINMSNNATHEEVYEPTMH